MNTTELDTKTLEEQIKEINEILKELKNDKKEEMTFIKNSHTTNMKKLDKLQEYNKIADMTNQLFEKRLSGIENAIKQISKSTGIKE